MKIEPTCREYNKPEHSIPAFETKITEVDIETLYTLISPPGLKIYLLFKDFEAMSPGFLIRKVKLVKI